MGLQRERVPAAAAALAAVLLALPTVFAPTWHLTTLDSQRGVVLFDQQFWSWGRSRVLGAGGAVVQDLWNPPGLVVLVVLLAGAAAGAVVWVLVRASWASVVASLAWAALLGRLVTVAAERHGRPVRDDVHGLAASGASTWTGVLESVSAVVLLAAVGLLVVALTGVRMPSAWVARVRLLVGPGDDGPARGSASAEPAGRPRPTSSWRPAPEPVNRVNPVNPVHRADPVTEPPAPEDLPGAAAPPSPAGWSVEKGTGRLVRLGTAVLGGVGVLLAATTAVWPTTVLAIRMPEVGDFTKGFEQRDWSWGRQVLYSSDGVLLDAYGGPNPVPRLVLLVAVLACALLALVAWAVRPRRRTELLAAAGTALALATVAASLVERLSFDERSIGLQPGLVRVTTPVGGLEVAAVAVLALTLAVIAVQRRLVSLVDARRLARASRASRAERREVVGTGLSDSALRAGASVQPTHTSAVGFRDEDERERRPR